jgi:hypothetical protein
LGAQRCEPPFITLRGMQLQQLEGSYQKAFAPLSCD